MALRCGKMTHVDCWSVHLETEIGLNANIKLSGLGVIARVVAEAGSARAKHFREGGEDEKSEL